MVQSSIYVLILGISLFLIIAIFGRAKKSVIIKIAMLIIGDIGLLLAQLYFSGQWNNNQIILLVLYLLLNIFAMKNILGKENPRQEEFNAWHDSSDNWKAGLFYYNKNDHRLLVPKRIESMGWTVNFANPLSIIAMLVLIIAFIVFAKILQ